jgi:thymidylate synthase ThyX
MGTKIDAELILASKNAKTGDILYTWRLTYPRFLLAEFNTHRVFSRNTSSSRAIPGKKVRRQILDDPFIPVYIGHKQKGMQAGESLTGWRIKAVKQIWEAARYPAVFTSWLLETIGAPKEIFNRLTEPWMWTTQVVSATEWDNFLLQRNNKMAEPHFRELARQIARKISATKEVFKYMALSGSNGKEFKDAWQELQPGEWHLPFATQEERSLPLEEQKAISVARCARTSYTLLDTKEPNTGKDIALGKELEGNGHWSPFEHQAQAMSLSTMSGNIKGWLQNRKLHEGENGGDLL